MVDPMTVVSLAGTIVQFVEFSSDVVSRTRELSKAGTTQDTHRSELMAKDLLSICEKLNDGLRSTGSCNTLLQDLCTECIRLGRDIVQRFSRLKVQDDDPKWVVLRKAVAAVWSKKELDDLSSQLSNLRSQLELRVLISFRDQFDLTTLQERAVDKNSRRIVSALLDDTRIFAGTADNLTKVASNEHETTRTVILEAVRQGSIGTSDGNTRRPSRTEAWANTQDEEFYSKEVAKDRILQSPLFPSITARYSQVSKAHAKTFEWIFESPQERNQSWSSFNDWLESGNGIYWINGKAGSGKSTLMRYLYDHHYTRARLESWSGPLPLTLASFFFWNSGTHDQKSQVGLLRALLYEVLSSHPSLIPVVLPDQWRDEYVCPTEYFQEIHWNTINLREAFRIIGTQHDLRIRLFIDGLDEYEGDGTFGDISALFAEIATSPNIKLCLSSRPWLVFEDAFQHSPSLRLQDLTSGDIKRYVEDKLNGHARTAKPRKKNLKGIEELIFEIVSKASGVFLWVELVVRSLMDGLTNRDRICDLQRRLSQLPVNLQELYRQMLFNQIDPLYHEESSQIFQIFRTAKDSAQSAFGGVDLLTLAFADEDKEDLAVESDIPAMSNDTLLLTCSDMADRLKSRCAGLLEVSELSSRNPRDMKVEFLHRTVRNFLEIPDVSQLRVVLPCHSFDSNERLAKSYLLQLKTTPLMQLLKEDSVKEPFRMATNVLDFARKSRDLIGNANIPLLDALDQTMQCLWSSRPRQTINMNSQAIEIRYKHCWACYAGRKHKVHEDILSVAVSYGMKEYVDAKLKDQAFLSRSRASLLHYIVEAAYQPDLEMVSLLLEHGARPNKDLGGQTMCQAALSKLAKPETYSALFEDSRLKKSWMEICKLLIEGGAECNAICLGRVEMDYSDLIHRF